MTQNPNRDEAAHSGEGKKHWGAPARARAWFKKNGHRAYKYCGQKLQNSYELFKSSRSEANFWISLGTWVLAFAAIAAYVESCEERKISRDALYSVQRAFLIPETLIAVPVQGTGDVFIGPPIANSGTTPAYHTQVSVSDCFRTAPLPASFSFPLQEPQQTSIMIGPKDSQFITGLRMSRASLYGVQTGQFTIYFWGVIRYRDIFYPRVPEHVTMYCVQLFGVDGDLNTGNITMRTRTCLQHNCTDEECHELPYPTRTLTPEEKRECSAITRIPDPPP
jgi:hypothetical protein